MLQTVTHETILTVCKEKIKERIYELQEEININYPGNTVNRTLLTTKNSLEKVLKVIEKTEEDVTMYKLEDEKKEEIIYITHPRFIQSSLVVCKGNPTIVILAVASPMEKALKEKEVGNPIECNGIKRILLEIL